jgi:transposase
MIGSIRQNGSTTCMTVEGAVNAEVFRNYVRDFLLPVLDAGDILVMDNLSSHKDSQALDLLKQAGVKVRFLPAYSPDYNPIELMWSKVKSLLRKAEARDNESFWPRSATRSRGSRKRMPLIGLPIADMVLFKML